MFDFDYFLSFELLGNTLYNWLYALIIFFVVLTSLKLFRKVILVKLKKIAKKTRTDFDEKVIDILQNLDNFFYFSISFYFSLRFLNLSVILNRLLEIAIIIILTFYILKSLANLIDYALDKFNEKREGNASVVKFMGMFLKGSLWLIALLFILSNLGYEITSLIAGLGVGGLAVALALQNVFDDIFSAISIYLDKPFEYGDFIIVGEHMGVVKYIGLKSTRIESLWGQEIVISNKELTSARIDNYKKMNKRRIHFKFGVTYQTSNKKLKLINEIVKEIFNTIDSIDLDRVHFKEFGDSALIYEIAYYVNSSDFNDYMNSQQDINFKLKERFEKEKIEFAYPTRTVFIQK